MSPIPSLHRSLRFGCLAVMGLLIAAGTSADWLVTVDGSRIETKGEWEVDGRRVVFTLPNGTLSAMRASEVDLEASRAATEEANRPPDEAADDQREKPKPEPVLVLTNKDIRRATAESETDDGNVSPSESRQQAIRVVEWNVESGEGGLRVVGRLENGSDRLQSGIRMRIEVRNDEGELMAAASSTVTRETLVAGGITSFTARFSGFAELPGSPTFLIDTLESRRDQSDSPGLEPEDPAGSADS